MKLAWSIVLAAAAAAPLAGCGSTDAASYQIAGAQHSLSLIRNRQFAWDHEWELALVTARSPECMRRHKLKPAPEGDFKVELFRSLEGNYIVKQGNNWYVTETGKCQLQQFKQPPREPGELLGTFNEKDGLLQFAATARPTAAATSPSSANPVAPANPANTVTPAQPAAAPR